MTLAHYTGEDLFKDANIYINKVDYFNKSTAFHSHNFVEIAFISSGSGFHILGDRKIPCSAGDIFIINYDVPHQFIPLDNCKITLYNCVFKPDFIDYTLINSRNFVDITRHFLLHAFITDEDRYYWSISLLPDQRISIDKIYEKMLYEFESSEEGYIELLRAYLIELLINIFRLLPKSGKFSSKVNTDENNILERAIQHIENNFKQDITVEDLSMIAFLSPSHFCRQFKKYMGMTVKEFTQRIRIEEACVLLKQTERKVTEIAAEVGYNDIKHFNEIFKRITGKTPSEYRR